MEDKRLKRYAERVGYTEAEVMRFKAGDHRVRHIRRMAEAAAHYSIQVAVIESRHCNSGHVKGQSFLLDMDGNFLTKYCPKKMCVYLISQLTLPVALINERLSEGLDPNDFHFMRQVQCPDTGVDCMGYGKVRLDITVIPRTHR